ncbi:hypothetical protein [Psychrobacillus lasiicapitis]|uniref:Uncharacterized protein n=1 Tax=Psychrobacillus lasiicapitis TaxID=1636719 RepID=A0A544TAH2_9BACI|nr:hypothetical protein [Psychrobacillus lasiicapitis]TQR14464.1 hypothetical protein FG382_08390 [Psychrobacillus lasiicapitis]GGA31113.1 hypothetical protein GCM10011384_20760 [Psychrobacillus lasiicapitis]
MSPIRITVNDDNRIPQVLADLSVAKQKKAKIGYMQNTELGMIASVHEFGARIQVTDKMRGFLASQGLYLKASTTHIVIPERSFLRTGTDANIQAVQDKAQELITKVVDGNVSVETFFEMVGLELKGKIQKYAIDLNNPVNHPFTVERKGSNNPLVDNGGLIQAMEVEIE